MAFWRKTRAKKNTPCTGKAIQARRVRCARLDMHPDRPHATVFVRSVWPLSDSCTGTASEHQKFVKICKKPSLQDEEHNDSLSRMKAMRVKPFKLAAPSVARAGRTAIKGVALKTCSHWLKVRPSALVRMHKTLNKKTSQTKRSGQLRDRAFRNPLLQHCL